jgi:glutamate-1-semialdehyde 2,1-aminomutase
VPCHGSCVAEAEVVYLANRGILMTPFHNMALMSPATSEADVDQHHRVFGDAVGELQGSTGC